MAGKRKMTRSQAGKHAALRKKGVPAKAARRIVGAPMHNASSMPTPKRRSC